MTQAAVWGAPSSGPVPPDTVAQRINDSLNSLLSTHKGASQPAYKVAGTMWLDDSNAALWPLKVYDGSQWIITTVIDPVSHNLNGAAARAAIGAAREKRSMIRVWDTTLGVAHTGSAAYGCADAYDFDEDPGSFIMGTGGQGFRPLYNQKTGLHRFTLTAYAQGGVGGRISLRANNSDVLGYVQIPPNVEGTFTRSFFARLGTVNTLLSYLIAANGGGSMNLYHAQNETNLIAEWIAP